MTVSLKNFNQALSEAQQLFDCFEALNGQEAIAAPDALKKASLILTLTAWETYVEDVAMELFYEQIKILKGSNLGGFAEKQLVKRLRFFHNPNTRKTKDLFEEFFNFDVTVHWRWNNVEPKEARDQLNRWISKRGDAVHRATVDYTQPQVINKKELSKCLQFFKELAQATDKALEQL